MKQSTALDILKAGRNVYLTGPAGSGKTHTLREYMKFMRDRNVAIGVTASTGIAATHFGGTTIHSWSGIGVRDFLTDDDIDLIVQKEYYWKRYNKTKVLIIDEVSMLSSKIFDSLDRLARAMKQKDTPFGGMQIVLSGDFFQLPPIASGSDVAEFVYMSEAWRDADIRVCYLEDQFRQNDNTLLNLLNELRTGNVSEKSRNILDKHIKENIRGTKNFIPTRLYTHNTDVDAINMSELDKLSGGAYQYDMDSRGKSSVVVSLKKGILAPERLVLKKDAVVMFVKNNFEAGYVNGTLGTITDFKKGFPVVRTFDGSVIYVDTAEWSVEEGEKVIAQVFQLPLRLAWAITVHKSQGMSLDAAEIDLSKSFVPGQGYVALSRLRSLDGLVLRGLNEKALSVHPGVCSYDSVLVAESSKWERVLSRFSRKDIDDMHRDFVVGCGGTMDKKEIAKNAAKDNDSKQREMEKKISTYEKTRLLSEQGYSLDTISEKRGLTVGTIISHMEKLKDDGIKLEMSSFKPKAKNLKEIVAAFKKSGSMKLSPVHKALGGKYSFEELRIARLFFDE